jgi:hypothetical protein
MKHGFKTDQKTVSYQKHHYMCSVGVTYSDIKFLIREHNEIAMKYTKDYEIPILMTL